ncbi:S-adenosyl-L-methionine-dependent methyltransferase [Entophlyctis helioformis]|nr:S-adenosyl-L-methionine-dependent methyltransferase [Entophlyctis helioformis]
MSLPTPLLSHISRKDYQDVYEPAEDTFLLLDALEADAGTLKAMSPTVCLEVGSGSGCVSTFLASLLGPSSALFLATDINAFAAGVSAKTAAHNNATVDPVVTSFADGLIGRIAHSVDVLLFNPPYVVTGSDEVGSRGIEAAWAGGIDGREVIDAFMPLVPQLLSAQGLFYLVLIKENRPEEIMQHMRDLYGMPSETVLRRRAGYEGLSIVRFGPPRPPTST